MNVCLACDGRLALLGQLGRLLWLRCTGCGLECSVAAEDAQEDEDDDFEEAGGPCDGCGRRLGDVRDECYWCDGPGRGEEV